MLQHSIFSLLKKLPYPAPLFAERFDNRPITRIATTVDFVRKRASYIAQTSLHGYLKARMGSSFRKIFEDSHFSPIIHTSSVRLFSSCLVDLSIYTSSKCFTKYAQQTPKIAAYIINESIHQTLDSQSQSLLDTNRLQQVQDRLTTIHWRQASRHEVAFAWSTHDILQYAPVIEQYKKLDATIVQNSIRFRWCDVCEQADKRLQAGHIAQDWMQNYANTSKADTKTYIDMCD